MTPENRAADLLANGYEEVTTYDPGPTWNRLTVGQRVRHAGEQYPEAIHEGTANIARIFIRRGRGHSVTDVELIVKRDKPPTPNTTYGFWADYHTVKAGQ